MVRTFDILNADVLIVGDEAAEVVLLELMLSSAGYSSVASTTDPLEVCDLHRQHRYDLILLDLEMPGMSGFRVIEGLREIEADGPLPVLAIAARAGDKTRAMRAGVKHFISKPFNRVAVLTRIRDTLKARLRRSETKNCASALEQAVEEQTAYLRWTQEGFRLMVESITDCAIVQFDADGRVLSWNSGAHRIKGWSAQEITGQHFSCFYAPEDIERGAPQRDLGLAAKGRFETQGWRARKDGSRFWAHVVLTPIRDSGGALRGFAQLTRDFTDRRQLEAHRKRNEERLESAALHDSLTGLANRQLLDDRVSLAIAHARRNKSAMAVVYLDLDGFNAVNDDLGHDAGDTLLQAVAQRLVGAVRAVDTVARLGGDEFGLVLWQISSVGDAAGVASKVIKTVSQPYDIGGRAVKVTISAGVAIYPAHGEDAATLLKSADLALHEAKHSGKDAYRIFDHAPLVSMSES